ncbi:trypsin-like peptidase domain-containing protein [Kitasatospora sp. NBC_01539]|uniref:VMAP-C domain-containing protein n=1 Tax=Kitasatospora sp. NBC_01539 TaxID=2903577 RepID=UPI0038600DA3
MQDVRWLARIDTAGPAGPLTGAGILISDREVLTCAHVVHGADRAEVRLVAHPDLPPITAAVTLRGPWPRLPGGAGDVAVLELHDPVPAQVAAPAPFAPLHRWAGPPAPALVAYGFPAGHDTGLSSEIRLTRGGFRIAGELVQLEHEGSGMPLSPGFSGGPVVIAETGEVAGLVTAALDTVGMPRGTDDRTRPAVRLGQMLPAEAAARYVPQLSDRLTGAALPAPAVRALRLLLAAAPPPADPLDLYRTAVGPLGCPDPPSRPVTLWDAGWYLLAEVGGPPQGPHPVVHFAHHVADASSDPALRRGLHAWLDEHRADPGAAAGPARRRRERWRPILVEIAPSGAGPAMFHVSVSAVRDGRIGPSDTRTVPRIRLQRVVRDRIDHELGLLEPDGAELVVFSLPRRWLTEPVHTWARRRTDFGPLGADHAVVVVDAQRRADPAARRQLDHKWAALRNLDGTRLHLLRCTEPADPKRLYHRLRPAERTEVPAFPGPPRGAPYEPLLAAALTAGAPAVLWRQQPCTADHQHGRTCRNERFLARLAEELAVVAPADLPRRIKELRHEAEEAADPAGHWAAGLVLLWEDPAVLPGPHRPYRGVPTAPPPGAAGPDGTRASAGPDE